MPVCPGNRPIILVIAVVITGARRSRPPRTINCSEKASPLALHQVDVVRDHHYAVAADDTDQRDEADSVSDRKTFCAAPRAANPTTARPREDAIFALRRFLVRTMPTLIALLLGVMTVTMTTDLSAGTRHSRGRSRPIFPGRQPLFGGPSVSWARAATLSASSSVGCSPLCCAARDASREPTTAPPVAGSAK